MFELMICSKFKLALAVETRVEVSLMVFTYLQLSSEFLVVTSACVEASLASVLNYFLNR